MFHFAGLKCYCEECTDRNQTCETTGLCLTLRAYRKDGTIKIRYRYVQVCQMIYWARYRYVQVVQWYKTSHICHQVCQMMKGKPQVCSSVLNGIRLAIDMFRCVKWYRVGHRYVQVCQMIQDKTQVHVYNLIDEKSITKVVQCIYGSCCRDRIQHLIFRLRVFM